MNQKHMKNANCLQICSQKVLKISTIFMVNYSVDNVLSEIGPYAYLA